MSYGYFSLPRSLTRDDLFLKLNAKQRIIFITILDHVLFQSKKFDDHGKEVELLPGQICTTIRQIVDWCECDITKNDVERTLVKLRNFGFLGQEVRHKKSIITITHKDTYDLILKVSETRSETRMRQERDKNETEKNNVKNENKDKKETLKRLTKIEKVPVEKTVEKSSVVSVSFLSHRENEELEALKAYAINKSWDISEESIRTWIKIHGSEYVSNQFKMLLQNKKSIRDSEEKWLQAAMIKDYWGMEQHRQENYDAVQGLKIQLGWTGLKLNKFYCVDSDDGSDYQYHLPTDELLATLSRKFEQKQERKTSDFKN